MKRFSATIDIEATPAAVWAVLVDTASWPAFDPYCERIEGQPALGETITVFNTMVPGRPFPVEITAFEQPVRFEWSNSLPQGALTSVRTHTIVPQGTGTHFELTEVVSGPLLQEIGNFLPDLTEPFAAFCHGLKAHVEMRNW